MGVLGPAQDPGAARTRAWINYSRPPRRTMSVVNITNIQVLDNPTRLGNPFQFEITFECIAALQNGSPPGCCALPSHCLPRFGVEDSVCGLGGGRDIRPGAGLHHGGPGAGGHQQVCLPGMPAVPAAAAAGGFGGKTDGCV